MTSTTDLGRRGEQLAADYLQERGCEILARNWRCRAGEIDLVARDGAEIAVVEVKTRAGLGYGHPFEAITARKLARLAVLARAWARESVEAPVRLRLDAIAVLVPPGGGAPTIEHLRGVGA